MKYYYQTGVIIPFAQKFYKQLVVAVAVLFVASMAAMTASVSAVTVSGCDIDKTGTMWTLESDCTSDSQINLPDGVTFDGGGNTISASFDKMGNSNNAAIGVIGVSNVVIENLVIDGTGGSGWPLGLHGINTYESSSVAVSNVTVMNMTYSGLVVNGADVTVDNVATENNGWHGINVAQGSGVDEPSVLSIDGPMNQSNEVVDIYVDDLSDEFTVTDALSQYTVSNPGYAGRNDQLYTWSDVIEPSQVDGMTIFQDGEDLGCYPFITERTITVDWNDSDAEDLDHYRYQADANMAPPYDFTTSVNASERTGTIRDLDGTYSYRVSAVDTSGNQGEWSDWCGVTLDRERPVVAINDPTSGAVLSGVVDVYGTIEDENPLRHRVRVYPVGEPRVYNGAWTVDTDGLSNELADSFDSAVYPDGEYRIRLIARDAANNARARNVVVMFDNYVNDASECKKGGWERGLFGGTSFRNQGDCVSYFATNGSNPATNGATNERANNKKNR